MNRLAHIVGKSVMRRILAILLICLMVPGGAADASSLVWCVSGSGHSAIELCGGSSCHYEEVSVDSHQRASASDIYAYDPHSEDCVDLDLLPTGSLKDARRSADCEMVQDDVSKFTLDLAFLNTLPRQVDHLAGETATLVAPVFRRENPAVKLRQVAVLRI